MATLMPGTVGEAAARSNRLVARVMASLSAGGTTRTAGAWAKAVKLAVISTPAAIVDIIVFIKFFFIFIAKQPFDEVNKGAMHILERKRTRLLYNTWTYEKIT
jgi:hypothetical protein